MEPLIWEKTVVQRLPFELFRFEHFKLAAELFTECIVLVTLTYIANSHVMVKVELDVEPDKGCLFHAVRYVCSLAHCNSGMLKSFYTYLQI
jgi:hypothetical protein